jgi:hypothetical protein
VTGVNVDKGERSRFCKPCPLDGLGPPKDVRASMSCSSVRDLRVAFIFCPREVGTCAEFPPNILRGPLSDVVAEGDGGGGGCIIDYWKTRLVKVRRVDRIELPFLHFRKV